MKKLVSLASFFMLFGCYSAQSEGDMARMVARACQTDSLDNVIGTYNKDSLRTYYVQTPDYETYGASSYEYDDFDLIFDISSNLLFNQRPFGKVDFALFKKKKAVLVIEIGGAGDRSEKGLWTYAAYSYVKPKGGLWKLTNVEYYYDDYFKGKKLK